MESSPSNPRTDPKNPNWVFSWRPRRESKLPKWFALLFVTGAYILFLSSVRIHAILPIPWEEKKATIIHISNDAESRALTLSAREGGPFPSRFQLSEWSEASKLEKDAFSETQWTPSIYTPTLQNLPENETLPLQLSPKGKPVFPKLSQPPSPSFDTAQLKTKPKLYPLSGITYADLPTTLPPYEEGIMASNTEPWRFLIRIDSSGNVTDCISLAGNNEVKTTVLENWLRKVTFPVKSPTNDSRWLSLAIGFTN